jgi:hypothetical protein
MYTAAVFTPELRRRSGRCDGFRRSLVAHCRAARTLLAAALSATTSRANNMLATLRTLATCLCVAVLAAACGGGDPAAPPDRSAAVGVGERRAADAVAAEVWTFIANEGAAFQVNGTQTVRYGLGSTWVQREVSGSGSCTNEFFGSDPAFLSVKRCEVLSTATPDPDPADVWTFIANENQSFQVSGTQIVRYGLGSVWVQRKVTDGGECSNAFFGSDPVFLSVKRCEVLSTVPPDPDPTEVWTFLANENEAFQVSGTQTVRYGLGSVWVQRTVTGGGTCSNAFFGSDPVFLSVKRCELSSGSTQPPTAEFNPNTANAGSPLGTNLGGISYFSTQVPFVDLFKSSAAWISGNSTAWDDGRAIDVDSAGWVKSLLPGQIARTTMVVTPSGEYPSGRYTVLHDGEGTIEYAFNWRKLAAESGPGRDVVEAPDIRGTFGLFITATNPANPLRNIRVIMPGGICGKDSFTYAASASACAAADFRAFEQIHTTQIFYPLFLERARKYTALRFMDWMETNFENQNGTWADRPQLSDARWTGQGGVPLEVMIELGNRLNASPWFNIPHRADDDYVRNFAQTVRDKLAPGLKVHLEYSNETWNTDFPAHAYAVAQAQALGIAAADGYTSSARYHARRAPQIFDIWSSVFGGNARLVRVLGGQLPATYLSGVVAGFENAYLKADAIGVNAYFNLEGVSSDADAERFAALTDAQAFEEIRTRSLPVVKTQLQAQIAAVARFNLKVMAFEAGNSLWPPYPARSNPRLLAKLDALQRDPGMKAIYAQYLNDWYGGQGNLMMHFVDVARYSEFGWFGALEYVSQPREQAPKFDALMSFIDANRNLLGP